MWPAGAEGLGRLLGQGTAERLTGTVTGAGARGQNAFLLH